MQPIAMAIVVIIAPLLLFRNYLLSKENKSLRKKLGKD